MIFNNSITVKGEYLLSATAVNRHIKHATLRACSTGVELLDRKAVVAHFAWNEIAGFNYDISYDPVVKGVSSRAMAVLSLKNGENIEIEQIRNDPFGNSLSTSTVRYETVKFERDCKKLKIQVLQNINR